MSDMIPENTSQGDAGTESTSAGGTFESTDSTAGQESNSTGYNPNWDEAFKAIPDVPEFHEKLKPVFQKWDESANSRYEKVQQEYAPYKQLIDNQVPFDDIRTAFEIRNNLTTDPRGMFDRLAQHLGIDVSKLEANGDESQGLNQYSDEEDDDPRITELRNQNQQILSALQAQAQERIDIENAQKQQAQEKQYYDTTVSELNALEAKYGEFDRNKAVQFAIWEAETKGTEVDFEAGFKAMKEFQGQAIQTSASRQAPDVFSGNGSLASGRVDTKNMSESEFQEYAVARMKAKLG